MVLNNIYNEVKIGQDINFRMGEENDFFRLHFKMSNFYMVLINFDN